MTKTLQDIDIKDIKKTANKVKPMYIRTSEKISLWMEKNKISPSKLFNEAATIIMESEENKKKDMNKILGNNKNEGDTTIPRKQ